MVEHGMGVTRGITKGNLKRGNEAKDDKQK